MVEVWKLEMEEVVNARKDAAAGREKAGDEYVNTE